MTRHYPQTTTKYGCLFAHVCVCDLDAWPIFRLTININNNNNNNNSWRALSCVSWTLTRSISRRASIQPFLSTIGPVLLVLVPTAASLLPCCQHYHGQVIGCQDVGSSVSVSKPLKLLHVDHHSVTVSMTVTVHCPLSRCHLLDPEC